MIPAPIPTDELQRLRALKQLCVLDTPAEERFDRITRLARRLFDVPIALVSLVDEERQWFKSRQGLDASETPRDVSLCGHAIVGGGTFVVEDAELDRRFHDNPLVTGPPHVRFYAGRTLQAPDGSALGTLCVIDHKARTISPEDTQALDDLAEMVEQELATAALATTDPVTQLSNRLGFNALAGHALTVADREAKPVSVIYFDLDGMKQINDAHGHAEGDRALRDFAGLLLDTFRDSDVIARLGGDEFSVLLSGSGWSSSIGALTRLEQAAETHRRRGARPYPLEFSSGLVVREPGTATKLEALLSAADEQMYQAKRAKRRAAAG